jgi:hypothetical protein
MQSTIHSRHLRHKSVVATEYRKCNAVYKKSYFALAGLLLASTILLEGDFDCLVLIVTARPSRPPEHSQ